MNTALGRQTLVRAVTSALLFWRRRRAGGGPTEAAVHRDDNGGSVGARTRARTPVQGFTQVVREGVADGSAMTCWGPAAF